ncbi:hypothetical protein LTS09_017826 [Friedmanniomyces endolithicus]|nr:hypothetical protein LTS09_017826 [Friedmanniomyces endolithicus]KAK0772831.1 hypothetical protein LTR38_016778 [Friedmanniomyces endolithicus]
MSSFSARPPSHFDRFIPYQGPPTSKRKRVSSSADTRVDPRESPTSATPAFESSSGYRSGSVAPQGSYSTDGSQSIWTEVSTFTGGGPICSSLSSARHRAEERLDPMEGGASDGTSLLASTALLTSPLSFRDEVFSDPVEGLSAFDHVDLQPRNSQGSAIETPVDGDTPLPRRACVPSGHGASEAATTHLPDYGDLLGGRDTAYFHQFDLVSTTAGGQHAHQS